MFRREGFLKRVGVVSLSILLAVSATACQPKKEVVQTEPSMSEEVATTETEPQSIKETEGTAESVTVNLYFVRHGKTILNTLDRVQGWSDSPLTKEGAEIAINTAYGLSDITFQFAYTSDRLRAIETAEIILEENHEDKTPELVKLWGLRETNFGKYEGEMNGVMWGDAMEVLGVSSMEELQKVDNYLELAVDAFAELDETGEAETYGESSARLVDAVTQIVDETKAKGGGNVLVAGHGAAISKIINELTGIPVGGVPNASISIVEYRDGKYKSISIGDMSYSEKGAALRENESAEVTVYLTRHGKTVFNTMDRVQGWVDSPLTEVGIEVAQKLGQGLSDVEFSAIYTSDLGRTIETAEIVQKANEKGADLSINKISGLRETNYGKYESGFNRDMLGAALEKLGMTMEEVYATEHPIKLILDALHDSDETKEAENYTEMSSRTSEAFKQICEERAQNGGGNILVVSHGNAIMAILAELGAEGVTEVENASVAKIIYKNGVYTVESVNDTSFIEGNSEK